MDVDPTFWAGKRTLVTGHTGFKGSWLSLWLLQLGASVRGFSHGVPTERSLYDVLELTDPVESTSCDVTDASALAEAARGIDVAFHLAAQPIVGRSLRDPLGTWQTNVLGTCSFLEAVRVADVRCAVVVTSDKRYRESLLDTPFLGTDRVGGNDPYSASKAAAECAVATWNRTFGLGVATARAGNVVGGGDWGEGRLVPDIVTAALEGNRISIRYPEAVRPWQHVLDPLAGYLLLAQALWEDGAVAGPFNFAPPPEHARSVRWVVERIARRWPSRLEWTVDPAPRPPESAALRIDSTRARRVLGWTPKWSLDMALDMTVAWYLGYRAGEDMKALTLVQLAAHRAAASTSSETSSSSHAKLGEVRQQPPELLPPEPVRLPDGQEVDGRDDHRGRGERRLV